jgi:peptidoglycan/xylan/chitin deacetylase (PgdA/CDA1 family)
MYIDIRSINYSPASENAILGTMRRLLVLLAFVGATLALAVPGRALAGPTVVSLTFDDGWDTQTTASSMLAAHGLLGTFYVNSGFIGMADHLTWAQLAAMNAAGNEVGGHTVDHQDLTELTPTAATAEVCDDRTAIRSHGFIANSFAYPFGAYDASTTSGNGTLDASSIVQSCGYTSGRGAFGLHNITSTTDTRPYATSLPPPNLFKIKTSCCINTQSFGGSTPTAAALESYVQNAQSGGGGWVIFFFHRLCDNCGGDTPAPSMSPTQFSAFLDWLTANGITVQTVGQVVSGDMQPPTSAITCNGVTCGSGWYGGAVTVSLSAGDNAGGSGVSVIHYTTDGTDPTVQSPTYSGPFSVGATTTVKYRAWDATGNVEPANSRTIQIDTTAPTSSISCNGGTCGGWYGAALSVSLQAGDAGSGVAVIRYTTDGTDPTPTSTAYAAPFNVSSTTTVKYRAWDVAGNAEATNSQTIQVDTTAPTSSITCNGAACSSWYGGSVSVSLSATDDPGGSGVGSIHYTTDGSTPSLSSTTYTAPFSVASTTTVKYRAWDNAGNAEATNSQLVQVDTTAPTASIRCNGTTCAAWYNAAVTVSLLATDGGSGVASIHYTTDGSAPTLASPTYSAPFSVASTTTVRYQAWDVAGNASTIGTQTIQLDTTAPSVTITSPADGARVNGNVTVSASAADVGSGVASVSFYLDGTTLLSTQTGTKYSFQWNTRKTPKGLHTLTAVATDRAGNRTTSPGVTVTVG